MTPTPSDRLDAALQEDDAFELLDQLAVLDSRYNGIRFSDRPAPLALFGSLFALFSAANGEGIWKFLSQQDGEEFHPALEGCRRIGAERAAEYLASVSVLYPGGRVPADQDERYAVVAQVEEESIATGDPDALQVLDERFDGALEEMAEALRHWVVAHRAEVVSQLAALTGPVKAVNELATMEEGLVTLEAAVEEREAQAADLAAMLRERATASGLLPWRDAGPDPRYAAFFEAVAGFGEVEWATVAARRVAQSRAIGAAESLAGDTMRAVAEGTLVTRALLDAARKRDIDLPARRAAMEKIRSLPRQVIHEGRKLGLAANAQLALVAAQQVLRAHDWLMLTPEGVAAARAAYAPFDGVAPTPALPEGAA